MPNGFTWAMLLLIAGIIGVIISQAAIKKAGTRKLWTWLSIGGLAIGAVAMLVPQLTFLAGLNTPVGSFGGTQTLAVQTTITPGIRPVACAVEDTTVTFSAKDAYSSLAYSGQHAYRVDGGPIRRVSNLGTDVLSPNNKLSILFGNATLSALSSSYFSKTEDFVIPCEGTFEATALLVQNGTTVLDVFNEEGDLITNTSIRAATIETLGAGDVVTLVAKIRGQFEREFPYGLIAIVEFDQGQYDDVIIDFGGQKTSVPVAFSPVFRNNRTVAYTIPALKSNAVLNGNIVIDSHNSNNPGGATNSNETGVPRVVLRALNYYVNEETGETFSGPAVEDEDEVFTHTHSNEFYVYTD